MKPVRWLEGGDDAPDGARVLLEIAEPIPPLGVEARNRGAQYAARLGAPKISGWSMSKGLVVLSVIAFVGPVVAVVASGSRAPIVAPSASVAAHAPAPVEPSSPEVSPPPPTLAVEALPSVPPRPSAWTAPRAPGAAPSSSDDTSDTLAREARLLEGARKELGPDPERALAILEEHARSFPRGALAVEREFLAVRALQHLDRHAEAETRARRVVENHPKSPYASRLKSLLAPRPETP